MRGAIIITFAAFLSRMLGAVYRPVAQIFLGDEGLALVSPPATVYQLILAISAVGLNVAISRLVSERLAVQDYKGARHIFRVSTQILLVSGLLFGLLFALSSGWLAAAQGYPEAWIGFLVLSPAIVLVTLSCAFRGLYQGMQQMRPSAVSQVVEQIGRVGVGILLIIFLSPRGLNLGAAGFNAGNTVGVLLGALYGGWIYFRGRPTADWTMTAPGVTSIASESTWMLIRKIFYIAVPLSLLGAVLPLMGVVDSALVTNRLVESGLPERLARASFAYLGNAGQLRDLPSILTAALYVSLVPAITECMATGREDQARYRASTAFRITFLFGIPATLGLLVGAREAYQVMFIGPGYMVMGPMAWSTIFLMVQQTSSGVLQGMGRIWISVRNILIGVGVKTWLTYWWTGIPSLMVNGAAYATAVGFAITVVLNMWTLRRELGLTLDLKDDIGRPLLAAGFMGLAIWGATGPIHQLVLGQRLPGLLTILLGGLVYVVAILLVGGVREADLHLIPGFRAAWIGSLRERKLLRD